MTVFDDLAVTHQKIETEPLIKVTPENLHQVCQWVSTLDRRSNPAVIAFGSDGDAMIARIRNGGDSLATYAKVGDLIDEDGKVQQWPHKWHIVDAPVSEDAP